jgi:hypothetical protein
MLEEIQQGIITRCNLTGGLIYSYITGELLKDTEGSRDVHRGEYQSQQTKWLLVGTGSDEVTLKDAQDDTCDSPGRPRR